MTRRCWQKCFIAILCAFVVLPYSILSISFIPDPTVVEDSAKLEIFPSKSCYAIGEDVWGVFRIAGNQTLGGFKYPYFLWVFDHLGNLVYHFEPHGDPGPEIRPGETNFYHWNQKNDDGYQVLEGNYTIHVGWDPGWVGNHSNVTKVYGEVNVLIGECPPLGLSVCAGPDTTSREGEEIAFNGSASFRLPLSCQDKDFSRNIKINDESSKATMHTASRLMDIKVDSNRTVHVVWSDFRNGNHDVFYSKSVDDGKTFSKNVQINSDGTTRHQWKPSMTIDSEGITHVAWEDYGFGPGEPRAKIFYSRSKDNGATFEKEILVSEGRNPSLAMDSERHIHVVFNILDIFHVMSNESGSGFSSPTRVNDIVVPVNPASQGKIAIDTSDTLHVVWSQLENIYYAKSTNSGKSFSKSLKVNEKEGSVDFTYIGPEIALDSYGNPHVVWSDNRRNFEVVGEVYYANSSDGGVSFNPSIAVHERLAWRQKDGFQLYWSIAIDESNTVHVTWIEQVLIPPANFDIYYATKAEGEDSFSFVERVNDNCLVSYRDNSDVALGPDGVPHILWYDLRDHSQSDVFFSKRNDYDEDIEQTPELYWDFDSGVDSDGDGNFTNDMDATGSTPTHIYGDNGNFTVTLKAIDKFGGWKIDTMNVTVLNVPPEVTTNYSCAKGGPVEILLRIAGEKWHDVSFSIYENDIEIYNETIIRFPGSPNEQMIGLENFALNTSRSYFAIVKFTPEDDKVNGRKWGATPASIILKSGGKEIARLHHTFNVGHPETWTWRVDDLNSYLPKRECVFTADIYDPGSDDIYVTWDWGDGTTTEHTYYNNGISPDPYPSPEVNPIYVVDEAKHTYESVGTYVVTLTTMDDDGGRLVIQVTLDIR